MKSRIFLTCWLALNMLTTLAFADIDIDTQDIGSENIKEPARGTSFYLNTHIDAVGKTQIDKGFFKGDDVHFAEAEGEVGFIYYYCPTYKEGAGLALGYTATYLHWSDNPWFNQDRFDTLSLSFTGFTERLKRWFWRAQFSINIDTDEWTAPYTNYDIMLWGRYEYCQNVGVHVGFLAQTGMRLDRVYPIFGFDWQISRKWKLNLVYPVNVSLDYALTQKWSLSIAGRNFNSRHRVHNNDSHAKALVRYENIGAEFAVKYEDKEVSANIHGGTTLDGRYRVANWHNHHAHTYKLKPSGYIGGEIDVKF